MNDKIAKRISNAILDYRDGESMLLAEAPFENADIPKKIDNKHIGLRITTATQERIDPLWVLLPMLLPDLEEIAIENECNIDYIEVIRVKADSVEDETIMVEIIEATEKRSVWVNE